MEYAKAEPLYILFHTILNKKYVREVFFVAYMKLTVAFT